MLINGQSVFREKQEAAVFLLQHSSMLDSGSPSLTVRLGACAGFHRFSTLVPGNWRAMSEQCELHPSETTLPYGCIGVLCCCAGSYFIKEVA